MTEIELSALNPANNDHEDHMLQARAVARRLGITIRTLDRWIKSEHINFPEPDRVTSDALGRPALRFWWMSTVLRWEAANDRPKLGPLVKTEAA